MRHVFHEIFARYLGSEQHAFEATPRELWPEPWSETRWQAAARAAGREETPDWQPGIGRGLESQDRS